MAVILIAEDHRPSREMLSKLLGYNGFDVFEAADGIEALTLAQTERPDLVIADILMPVMDGYEFARRLRADPEIAQTPIIFYTATYLESEAHILAKLCGAFRLLIKPVEPEAILEAVGAALAGVAPPSVPLQDEAFDFNHQRLLTNKLVSKVDELEREMEVRARAEEALRESEEVFHRLSVGRELRMIELKKEVNAMAELAGQTLPYDLSRLDERADQAETGHD